MNKLSFRVWSVNPWTRPWWCIRVMWNVWCQNKEKTPKMKHCKDKGKKLYSAHRAIAPRSTLGIWEGNCQQNQRKVSVKCKQSFFYNEADLLSSFLFTDSADAMTTCFKEGRLFWKTSVKACIVSGKWQRTTAWYELSMSSKRQVWQHDFSSCRSSISIIDVGFFLRSWWLATCKWASTALI